MAAHKLRFLLLEVLIVSLIFPKTLLVFSSNEKAIFSENASASRRLYLNDSWNDAPTDLRKTQYRFAEIRKVEVENDTVIICANATIRLTTSSSYSVPSYLIFFDTNNDSTTEFCWRYQKGIGYNPKDTPFVANYSFLYRFSDQKFYYNGTWIYTALPKNFEGEVIEDDTTGESVFHLGKALNEIAGNATVNGTLAVRIKVASLVKIGEDNPLWEGDLVPGPSFSNVSKVRIGWPYKNASDATFSFSNDTVELEARELPPSPPPPPPPPKESLPIPSVQMMVWAMQAIAWIREGLVNLPFWIRDNAVTGSLIVTVLLFSSYSLVKKWRTNKQRLKRAMESAESIPTTLILAENLTKHYGIVHAVDNLSLEVEEGSVIGLIGPNGAGKTTTIKMILGLLKPDNGHIEVFGKNPWDNPDVRTQIGVVYEKAFFPAHQKTLDYLERVCRIFGVPESRAKEVLRLVNLEEASDMRIKALSAGMLQKLAIAHALIHKPKLIIADEITANLDPPAKGVLLDLVLKLHEEEKVTFLLSSRTLPELSRVCDSVALINRGKVWAFGNSEALHEKFSAKIVRISTDQPEKLAGLVQTLSYVEHVSTDNRGISVKVAEGKEDNLYEDAPKLARKGGVKILGIESGSASLEELYRQVVTQEGDDKP